MGHVLRKTMLATVAALALVGIVSALASAATNPVITFVAPSPAPAPPLTTGAVEFKFTYNKKPSATKTLTCTLSGPTPKSGCDPANPAAFGTKASQSGASYSGLANGSYTFTVSLTLTDGGTATASRSFTVAVNQPPVANDVSASTMEDVPVTITLSASDIDSAGTVAVTDPEHGTLGPAIPISSFVWQVVYTPEANYNGPDSFTYKANDGSLDSNVATVSLTVNPVNDAPVANNDSFTTNEDHQLPIAAPGVLTLDTDVDGDSLAAVLVSDVAHGTLSLSADGSFTYTPVVNFSGLDSFTYMANDGSQDSNVAQVLLTVAPINDAPVAVNDASTTNEDTPLNIAVLANDGDVDGDSLTAVLVSAPAHGTATLNADGSFTYTPAANYNGFDSFTYRANDGSLNSNGALVSLTVAPVNDAPVANDDGPYSTTEGAPLSVTAATGVLINDTDVDGDAFSVLSFGVIPGDFHGSLLSVNADGSFSYTPQAGFVGEDKFFYNVDDGNGGTDTGWVTVTVNAAP